MKDSEAQRKACPIFAVAYAIRENSGESQNEKSYPEDIRCIASDCMMWVPERRSNNGHCAEVDGGYCGLMRNN